MGQSFTDVAGRYALGGSHATGFVAFVAPAGDGRRSREQLRTTRHPRPYTVGRDELAKLRIGTQPRRIRVSDLEREWREAVEATATASAALAEVERHGGSATTRHKAEEALAAAKQRAGEPWAERVEGAKAAARDLDKRYRAYVSEHLGELVEALEQDGKLAAEAVNRAAGDLVTAHAEWGAVAAQIGTLVSQVSRVSPGDVSYPQPQADEAARGAIALVAAGGEYGPRLARDREPWSSLLGANDVVEVDDVAVIA